MLKSSNAPYVHFNNPLFFVTYFYHVILCNVIAYYGLKVYSKLF